MIRIGFMVFILIAASCAHGDTANKVKPVEFPNIPTIKTPSDIHYGGFFKKNNPVKLVFGVSDPGSQLKESLTNAAYTIKYLKPRGIPYKIQIVLYGRAVLAASVFSETYGGYAPLIQALNKHKVEFVICNNSLAGTGLPRDELFPFVKLVPAGILQLVKKQMQGFAYINNASIHK